MNKLAACIVETRPLDNLIEIIEDHLKNLPIDTDLFIFHGRSNRFLKLIFPKAKMIEFQCTVNERIYNELLTSTQFWDHFLDYEHVFIFQSDGMILRPGIEEFYEYDYCGSPWKFQLFGGNGGMSLRNPKIMHDICSEFQWDSTQGNEDIFFSNLMFKGNIGNLAPREVCMRWGTESIFELGTFCYHAINKHLTQEQCEKIKNQYK